MVWGLSMPSSFGDFFPQGNYVGWDEELTRYFNEEMTSEQRGPFVERGPIRYIRYVAGKFINECGKKLPELPPFGLIESHEPPQWYELRKRCTSLGSLIQLAAARGGSGDRQFEG